MHCVHVVGSVRYDSEVSAKQQDSASVMLADCNSLPALQSVLSKHPVICCEKPRGRGRERDGGSEREERERGTLNQCFHITLKWLEKDSKVSSKLCQANLRLHPLAVV